MPNTIFFKPAGQIENTGDLLINKAEIDVLRLHGNIVIDDSNTPTWFIDAICDNTVDERLSKISSKSLRWSILVSLISKTKSRAGKLYYVIPPGHRSTKGLTSALRSLSGGFKNYILKLFGCRIIRMGFSIGPFDSINGKIDSITSGSYYYFGVRDTQSLALANRLKFKNPQYFPDLAWCYKPYKQVNTNTKNDQEYIVLSFRSNEYGTQHREDYLVPIVTKIKALLEGELKNCKIVLAYQVQYDRDAAIYIAEKLSDSYNTEVLDHKMLLPEAEQLYNNAKVVISNRLHVLLLAFQCGTLSIPLIKPEDNKKIVGIYTDNGLGDMILDSEKDIDELQTSLTHIIQNERSNLNAFQTASKNNTDIIRHKLVEIFH
jgi:polysaccharide pyruvyl transferase WcaK-like protein